MTQPTIDQLLKQATAQLRDISPSARADSQILLCHVLGKPASYLLTWPERAVEPAQVQRFAELLARRVAGEPVAYILGRRGFWTLDLKVSSATLIPRPETELLVEQALSLRPATPCRVLDLGTGTGAIALAIASERPAWSVTAVERAAEAVTLARENAAAHGLDHVEIRHGSWFEPLAPGEQYDVIVSNPPYIDAADPHLAEGDVRFEPHTALVADQAGLADIDHIITQGRAFLVRDGWLLLEHGWTQGDAVRELFIAAGFDQVETLRDLAGHDRITRGHWPGHKSSTGG